jgi:hypothetical protein
MTTENYKILRFRVEFITSEEDCDEVTGIINNEKKVVELIEVKDDGSNEYKGFIPFSSIKKLEIIDEDEEEEE